jgi:2-keto-3-deoxy-L-rhamnonate aldolase RhmA
MNLISKKFYFDKITVGSWLTTYSEDLIEIFIRNKLDWIVIDLEHSHITIDQAANLIRLVDLAGSRPLVRLTSNSKDQIKRILDSGAHGIIVPMVNSEEEARKVVDYTKYMPSGSRGVGLARAQGYGANFDKYRKWQEKNILVIAQIEHIKGVDNLEKIISVTGIDGIFIGPYDLSGSIGEPGIFSSKRYLESIKKIKSIMKTKKKICGIHIVEPETKKVNEAIKEGFNFIAYSVDIRILDSSLKTALATIKKE